MVSLNPWVHATHLKLRERRRGVRGSTGELTTYWTQSDTRVRRDPKSSHYDVTKKLLEKGVVVTKVPKEKRKAESRRAKKSFYRGGQGIVEAPGLESAGLWTLISKGL